MIAIVFLLGLLGVLVVAAAAGAQALPIAEILMLIGVFIIFFSSGVYIAAVLGVLAQTWNWPTDRIAAAFAETPHGPGTLSAKETARLSEPRDLAGAPDAVAADLPDWLAPAFARVFGDRTRREAEALARRSAAAELAPDLGVIVPDIVEGAEAPDVVGI
jgi:hypothetical protein